MFSELRGPQAAGPPQGGGAPGQTDTTLPHPLPTAKHGQLGSRWGRPSRSSVCIRRSHVPSQHHGQGAPPLPEARDPGTPNSCVLRKGRGAVHSPLGYCSAPARCCARGCRVQPASVPQVGRWGSMPEPGGPRGLRGWMRWLLRLPEDPEAGAGGGLTAWE